MSRIIKTSSNDINALILKEVKKILKEGMASFYDNPSDTPILGTAPQQSVVTTTQKPAVKPNSTQVPNGVEGNATQAENLKKNLEAEINFCFGNKFNPQTNPAGAEVLKRMQNFIQQDDKGRYTITDLNGLVTLLNSNNEGITLDPNGKNAGKVLDDYVATCMGGALDVTTITGINSNRWWIKMIAAFIQKNQGEINKLSPDASSGILTDLSEYATAQEKDYVKRFADDLVGYINNSKFKSSIDVSAISNWQKTAFPGYIFDRNGKITEMPKDASDENKKKWLNDYLTNSCLGTLKPLLNAPSAPSGIGAEILQVVTEVAGREDSTPFATLWWDKDGDYNQFKKILAGLKSDDDKTAIDTSVDFLKTWLNNDKQKDLIDCQHFKNVNDALDQLKNSSNFQNGLASDAEKKAVKIFQDNFRYLAGEYNNSHRGVEKRNEIIEENSFYASIDNKQSFLCEDPLFLQLAKNANSDFTNSYSKTETLEESNSNFQLVQMIEHKYKKAMSQDSGYISTSAQSRESIAYRAISYARRRYYNGNKGDITANVIKTVMRMDSMVNEKTGKQWVEQLFKTFFKLNKASQNSLSEKWDKLLKCGRRYISNSNVATGDNLHEYALDYIAKDENTFTKALVYNPIVAKYAGIWGKAYVFYTLYVGHSMNIKGNQQQAIFVPMGLGTKAGEVRKANTFVQLIYTPDVDSIEKLTINNGQARELEIRDIYDLIFKQNQRFVSKNKLVDDYVAIYGKQDGEKLGYLAKRSWNEDRKNRKNSIYEDIEQSQESNYKQEALDTIFSMVLGDEGYYSKGANYSNFARVFIYKGNLLNDAYIINVINFAKYIAPTLEKANQDYKIDWLRSYLPFIDKSYTEFSNIFNNYIRNISNGNVSSSQQSDTISKHQPVEWSVNPDPEGRNVQRIVNNGTDPSVEIQSPQHTANNQRSTNVPLKYRSGTKNFGNYDNIRGERRYKGYGSRPKVNEDFIRQIGNMISLMERMTNQDKQREHLR